MSNLIGDLYLLFQRLDLSALLDLLIVTSIFFGLLMMVRDTQAMVLIRGIFLIIILLSLLTSFGNLPAFSWLIQTTLPALLFAIPVIFAPEIRRGLEKLGRAGSGGLLLPRSNATSTAQMEKTIKSVVSAASRLSARQHGALIVIQRSDNLRDYTHTGVTLNAEVTPELLLQIFYPNTPLHDGAVIISDHKIIAASCVMPLSASGVLARSPERQQMGLRHRAALGISEASDAVALVVSEQTGSISVAHSGRMIRRLDPERVENIMNAFFKPSRIAISPDSRWLGRLFPALNKNSQEEEKRDVTP